MTKQLRNKQMYQVIEVDSYHLLDQAYDIEGQLQDKIRINKA